MTDYLDQLLEQPEQEEQGQGLEWPGRGLRLWAEENRGEENTLAHAVHPQKVDRVAQVQISARMADQAVGMPSADTQPLTAQLDRLRRVVQRAQAQAGHQTASAEQRWAHSEGTFAHSVLPRRRAADYAALVDAAFQRDARRYDGPLGLL